MLSLVVAAEAAPISNTEVVALIGDVAPDANGIFSNFTDAPSLNDAGQTAFHAYLSGTSGIGNDHTGVFIGDGVSALTQVVRGGHAAPDGNGSFADFHRPAINQSGQAAFFARLSGTSGGVSDDRGLFVGDTVNGVVQVFREGQTAPDNNGSFVIEVSSTDRPVLNASGQVAFFANLTGTSGGSSDNAGVFLGNGQSGLVQIARTGQTAPGSGFVFYRFNNSAPALNDAGLLAFSVTTLDLQNFVLQDVLYVGDGVTDLVQIVSGGQSTPSGDGSFDRIRSLALNNAGQIAFNASLSGVTGGTNSLPAGLYLHSDGTGIVELARADQAAPNGDGVFYSLGDTILNEVGQVAFAAGLVDTSTGGSNNVINAIFLADGVSDPIEVVRVGMAAPDNVGLITSLGGPMLNDSGQMAIPARFTSTDGMILADYGILWYDESVGLVQVAREGDTFLGSTISYIDMRHTDSYHGDEASGFNALGQISFRFELDDGRKGIAIWTPPGLALAGDVNGDGFVGIEDLDLLLANWGGSVTAGTGADLDGDGTVGQGDLDLITANWGAGNPSDSSIPEPGSLALMILAGAALIHRNR